MSAKITYFPNGKTRREEYRVNGVSHRDDGPAIIRYYDHDDTCFFRIKQFEYWYNGEQVRCFSLKEYLKYVDKVKFLNYFQ